MSNRITVCENALEPSTWDTHVGIDDVCKFLAYRFIKWPETAKIYQNVVSQDHDVTPYDEAGIEQLQKLTGHFFIVVYPEGIETILIIVAIAVAAASIGLSFLLRPKATPNIQPNQSATSPNNSLSDRQNTERLNGRIPDIFGKVWSTPDLIAVPYKIFIAGVETEYAYYCIGRGSYTIDQIRDDLTPLAQITGSSAEIYGPFTSPNNGATPQLRIGTAIGQQVLNVKASSSVNGQTLIAPNLTGAGFIGPFLVGDTTTTDIWFNFVAESGAYQIPSATGVQAAITVAIEVGITPVNAAGAPIGAEVFTSVNLVGSATLKSQIGATLQVHLGTVGMSSVRAHRTTNENVAANTSVSDEIKWRDCYAISPIVPTDFGNVTTVQTLTLPTPEALALQQRKLNLLVTRNVQVGTLTGGVVTFAFGPSRSAADILVFMAQDSRIGNRSVAEIDFNGIYATINAVAAYFATTLATEFCFTFDDASVSFEDAVADLAAAVGCVAYRRGNLLTLSFEKQTVNSTILWCHRNKVPNSETRTVTFGFPNDIDGLNFTYIEPNDPLNPNQDIAKTLSFPLNTYHIHCTGGTNLVRYFWVGPTSVLGVNYVLQIKIKNEGLAPLNVFDDFLHSQTIASGATVNVSINFVGDGSSSILLQFQSQNISDELNFDVSNPYIANLANGINLIPVADMDFVGGGWSVGSGGTIVVVTQVQPTAVNPKSITSVGIRNNVQAYLIASRIYNKLLYQNTVVQFQGLEEAALLVLNDRMLVADNTRQDTQDGQVIGQNGLLLTLSQPAIFVGGLTYTIFLQHYDETVESIAITQPDATKPTQVLLAGAPALPLVVDYSANNVLTTYQIVSSAAQRANAFLLASKSPQNAKTYTINGTNYDDRYYLNDVDVFKGFVVSNGAEGTSSGGAIAAGGTYRPTAFNDIGANPTTGLTVSAGFVSGSFTPGSPGSNHPPFSDPTPPDDEPGDCIWNAFAPVSFTSNVTLHVVVSAISNATGTVTLILNGTTVTLAGAGTYTVTIFVGTFLSSINVEAKATGRHTGGGGSASITITDIFVS